MKVRVKRLPAARDLQSRKTTGSTIFTRYYGGSNGESGPAIVVDFESASPSDPFAD